MNDLYMGLLIFIIILSVVLIIVVIVKTVLVKSKGNQIRDVGQHISIGMTESQVYSIMGEPNSVGRNADGDIILSYSIDTKNYSSIFAQNTYHVAEIVIRNGKVFSYKSNG